VVVVAAEGAVAEEEPGPVLSGDSPVAVGAGSVEVGAESPLSSPPAQAVVTRAIREMTAARRRTRQTVGGGPYMRGKSSLSPDPLDSLYNRRPVPNPTLYFAYGSFLDPDRIAEAAPGSRFLFTAHYPEVKLGFASSKNGAVPTLIKESGHTVWGGVFEIPDDQVASLTAAEAAEGRQPGFDLKAVDREGNKHECLTFVAVGEANGDHRPDPVYLESMIRGARHWSLPAGWVMGLEDLADDPLFS